LQPLRMMYLTYPAMWHQHVCDEDLGANID